MIASSFTDECMSAGDEGDRVRDGASFQYRSLADTSGPERYYVEGDPDE